MDTNIRKGFEWDDEPYRLLIKSISLRNLDEYSLDLISLSKEELNVIICEVYTWANGRFHYTNTLENFILKYYNIISEDCKLYRDGRINEIFAPRLRKDREILMKTAEVMGNIKSREHNKEIIQFLNDESFFPSLDLRKRLAKSLGVDDTAFRKLNYNLRNKRQQLCQILQQVLDAKKTTCPQERKLTHRRQKILYKEEEERKAYECLRSNIRNKMQDGLKVETYPNKGLGITSTTSFKKGEFICEYRGSLHRGSVEKQLHKIYENESKLLSYIIYFKIKDKSYCIDATYDDGSLGRLINHSKFRANVKPTTILLDNIPRLYFVALRDIKPNEEILYDYGERSPVVIKSNPWLLE